MPKVKARRKPRRIYVALCDHPSHGPTMRGDVWFTRKYAVEGVRRGLLACQHTTAPVITFEEVQRGK